MSVRVHTIPMGLSLAYLIESPRGLALVDAGLPGLEQRVLKRLEAIGRKDLRLIFLTHAHFDHYGSAAELRRATGAVIAIHEADAGDLAQGRTRLGKARGWGRLLAGWLPLVERVFRPEPIEADLLVSDGEVLTERGPAIHVCHTPGHTMGSGTLIVDGRLAFAGDLISTTGKPHRQRLFAQDWGLITHSVKRLLALKPVQIFPGHGRRALAGESGHYLLSNLEQQAVDASASI